MTDLAGHCHAAFGAVAAALAENLADPAEIGQAVAVTLAGEVVVDLWGGYCDPARSRPWAEDTLVCVFSVGKPIAALPLLMLLDEERVGLHDAVTSYWPEYGQAGKHATTIRHVLSHMAGIPGAIGAARDSAYDWPSMVTAVERQTPLWPPGENGCYHTFTYGYLVGEIARRVTGREIGELVAERLAAPLDLEIAFGLDRTQQARCADVVWSEDDPLITAICDPETLIGRCWAALPLGPGEEDFNSSRFRSAQMPSFNGHATVRSLARLFAALANGGEIDGTRLLSAEMVETATTVQWQGVDALGLNGRFGLGFRRSNAYAPFTGNDRAFGHTGIGGALAFADPDLQLSFAFAPNRLAPGPGQSKPAKRLVDAVMRSL